MSSNKRKFTHISSSKSKKVRCRVETCQQNIIEQGYSRHLKTTHPKEDFNDLRSYGIKKFSWGRPSRLESAELSPQVDQLDGDDAAYLQQWENDADNVSDEEDNEETRDRFRERSCEGGSSEEEGNRLDGRKEQESQLR